MITSPSPANVRPPAAREVKLPTRGIHCSNRPKPAPSSSSAKAPVKRAASDRSRSMTTCAIGRRTGGAGRAARLKTMIADAAAAQPARPPLASSTQPPAGRRPSRKPKVKQRGRAPLRPRGAPAIAEPSRRPTGCDGSANPASPAATRPCPAETCRSWKTASNRRRPARGLGRSWWTTAAPRPVLHVRPVLRLRMIVGFVVGRRQAPQPRVANRHPAALQPGSIEQETAKFIGGTCCTMGGRTHRRPIRLLVRRPTRNSKSLRNVKPKLASDVVQVRVHVEHVGVIADQQQCATALDKAYDGVHFLWRVSRRSAS